ncbi:MAG: hypothetical protein AB8F26_12360, partial [Phycisphaerales bacterium]
MHNVTAQHLILFSGSALFLAPLVAANAQQVEEPRIDERTSSLVQRTHTKRDQSNRGMPPLMIRSIDGY